MAGRRNAGAAECADDAAAAKSPSLKGLPLDAPPVNTTERVAGLTAEEAGDKNDGAVAVAAASSPVAAPRTRTARIRSARRAP